MRKNLILLLSFIPFITSSQVKMGLTAGYLLSNIGRYDLIENHRIGNISAGVMAEYRFNQSPFYLSGKAVYTTFGYGKSNLLAYDKSGNPLGDVILHRISYINVPIHILFGVEEKSMIIKAGLGPFVAFHIGDKMRSEGGNVYRNGAALPRYKKGITPVLYGPSFQAGVQWTSFIINFHFSQSLNGLYESEFASAQKWKIADYGISIGYFITKKK